MRSFMFLLTAMAVIGMAFWAYRENYATQRALNETSRLHTEIGQARARLAVLRAEWAYLNRPDRLLELVEINFDRLGLLPLRPDQFGQVDQISYPSQTMLSVTNAVDVANLGEYP
jgi:hypothetical protein